MVENKQPQSYTEKYEFRLTIGNNIICQRFFRINNFNETCLNSVELSDTIRECANMIDSDLRSKSTTYVWMMAPQVFKDSTEMKQWIEKIPLLKDAYEAAKKDYEDALSSISGDVTDEEKKALDQLKEKSDYAKQILRHYELSINTSIVLNSEPTKEYLWNGEKVLECPTTERSFDNPFVNDEYTELKFSFLVSGREVCSAIWNAKYPRIVRNDIDLSNKKWKYSTEESVAESGLSHYDISIRRAMVGNAQDLVYPIVKKIENVCSFGNSNQYTTTLVYRNVDKDGKENGEEKVYANSRSYWNSPWKKEMIAARKYLESE